MEQAVLRLVSMDPAIATVIANCHTFNQTNKQTKKQTKPVGFCLFLVIIAGHGAGGVKARFKEVVRQPTVISALEEARQLKLSRIHFLLQT